MYIKDTMEMLGKIDAMKRKSAHFFTNAYMETNALDYVLGNSEIYETEGSVSALFNDNGIIRAYMFAESVEYAAGLKFPGTEILLEIIERNKDSSAADLFTANGWKVHSRLTLLRNSVPQGFILSTKDIPVEIAGIKDAEAVCQLLYDSFDVKVAHLPNKKQLEEYIKNKEVLVIRDGSKIAATAVFIRTGEKTKIWFQLTVREAYRGKRYAQALIDFDFLRSGEGIVYTFWVVDDNIPILRFHKKNGVVACSRYLTVFSRMPQTP